MAVVKLTPFLDNFDEIENMFDDFGRVVGWKQAPSMYPLIDLYEDNKNLIIDASLPGIDIKNVSVFVENGILVIRGEEKRKKEVDEKKYYIKETNTSVFQRLVKLPVDVVADKAKATYKNGILKITIPKKEKQTEKNIINIEVKS